MGGRLDSDQVLGTDKVHGTRDDAYKCYTKYLVAQGYERLSSTEFRSPNNGPILVISKRSKFGGELRLGKNLEGKGARFMPRRRNQGIVF